MSFELLFFLIFSGGWLFGKLFEKIGLPSVLGMTVFGIGLALLDPSKSWPAGFVELVPFMKSLALVIILLRAGLGISRLDLQKAGISALLMTFLPCLLEGFALMALFMNFFGFSWEIAGLTGFMLAAVSPAVVVPSMLDLKSRGKGSRNGVITTILAGASADDVFAITLFTFFLGFAQGDSPEQGGKALEALLFMPVSLLGGVLIGSILGLVLAWWFKKHHQGIRATEKVLLLLGCSLFLIQVGNWIHLAALLGVMATGFILLERAETQAHELGLKLGKIWIFAQIALFVIIGMSLDFKVALSAGPKAVLIIGLGLVARSIGVILATIPSAMSMKERAFCVIAYLPKATVQAALGGVALAAGIPEGNTILAIAVVSILFTAPLGLLGIRLSSPYLLND